MRKTLTLIPWIVSLVFVLAGLLAGPGCGDDKKKKEDVEVTLDPYSIVVRGDDSMGVVGEVFHYTAGVSSGEPQGTVSFEWSLPEGATLEEETTLTDASIAVSFSDPGTYAVEVTANDGSEHTASSGALVNVFEGASVERTVGDVDGDGVVDSADVTAAQGHLDATPLAGEEFHRADVIATGEIEPLDVDLIQNAADNGGQAPIYLSRSDVYGGTSVLLIHPALLEPAHEVELRFHRDAQAGENAECTSLVESGEVGADDVMSFRGKPGYMRFVVPMRFTCIQNTETVRLALAVDTGSATGFEEVETWDLTVDPLPAPSAEPGAMVLGTLEDLGSMMDEAEATVAEYTDVMEAPDEEKAVLRGLTRVAAQKFSEHRKEFNAAFALLDPTTKALFEQLAMANGLAELRSHLDRAMASPNCPAQKISASHARVLLNVICTAREVAAISQQVAEVNETVSGILDYVSWGEIVPVVGQAISALNTISSGIALATDIIDAVAQFIPSINQALDLVASPTMLQVGQSTQFQLQIDLGIYSNICYEASNHAIGNLTDRIKEILTNKIVERIPLLNKAWKTARRDPERLDNVMGFIYDIIGDISGAAVDVLGVEGLLQNFANRLCDKLPPDPVLPLEIGDVTAECGTVTNGQWTCTQECAETIVRFETFTELCSTSMSAAAHAGCREGGNPNVPLVQQRPPNEPLGPQSAGPPPSQSPDGPVIDYSSLFNNNPSPPSACPEVDPMHPPQFDVCGAVGDELDLWYDYSGAGAGATALYIYDRDDPTSYWAVDTAQFDTGDTGSALFEAQIDADAEPGTYRYGVFVEASSGYSNTYDLNLTVEAP